MKANPDDRDAFAELAARVLGRLEQVGERIRAGELSDRELELVDRIRQRAEDLSLNAAELVADGLVGSAA